MLTMRSADMINFADDKAKTSSVVASTPLNLADIGLDQIAYIRRAVINDRPMW